MNNLNVILFIIVEKKTLRQKSLVLIIPGINSKEDDDINFYDHTGYTSGRALTW